MLRSQNVFLDNISYIGLVCVGYVFFNNTSNIGQLCCLCKHMILHTYKYAYTHIHGMYRYAFF